MTKLTCVSLMLFFSSATAALATESPNGALARRDYTDTLKSIVFLQDRAQFMEATAQKMGPVEARKTRERIARIHNTVERLKKQAVRLKRNLEAYNGGPKRTADARPRRTNPFLREDEDRGTIYKGLTMGSRRPIP